MSETYLKIKHTCLKLLAQREHSQQELVTKLQAKGFTQEEINPVLIELAEKEYQSDKRYAQSYIRSRMNKGYGKLAISHSLKQKGISSTEINSLFQEQEIDELSIIQKTYDKKYKTPPLTREEWAKRSRFLMQRGFSTAMITVFFRHLSLHLD